MWLVAGRSPAQMGEVNATTLGLFAASTAFPLVAALTIGTAIWVARDADVGFVFKAYLLLIAAAGGTLSVFAWSAHWLALRTWAW
jgi:hypothetical protein